MLMRDDQRRKLFGQFVRSKREALQPKLESNRRQRTPGLRREELALRAGISTIWCAWIEQGRSTGISLAALNRLASALELTADERHTFFSLAGKADRRFPPSELLTAAPPWVASLIASMQTPAFALDGCWNAVCANEAAERLLPGWLGDECDRNLLRYAFLNKEPRSLFTDWLDWAGWLVTDFRDFAASKLESAAVRDLVEPLARASTTFARLWDDEGEVRPIQSLWPIRSQNGELEVYVASRLRSPGAEQIAATVLVPVSSDLGVRNEEQMPKPAVIERGAA